MPAAAVARPAGGEIIPQKARSAPALQGHVPPTAAPPPPRVCFLQSRGVITRCIRARLMRWRPIASDDDKPQVCGGCVKTESRLRFLVSKRTCRWISTYMTYTYVSNTGG